MGHDAECGCDVEERRRAGWRKMPLANEGRAERCPGGQKRGLRGPECPVVCVCVCVAAGYGSAGDHSSITFQAMLRGVVPAKREAKQVAEKIMLGM